MKEISKNAKSLFEQWGQKGGRARARRLSSHKRSEIAVHAARARWNERDLNPAFLPSVRLRNAQLEDPAYLEEILSEGTWKDWQRLYEAIADRPFGATAEALEKTCSAVEIYGATALWKGLLGLVRGVPHAKEKTN